MLEFGTVREVFLNRHICNFVCNPFVTCIPLFLILGITIPYFSHIELQYRMPMLIVHKFQLVTKIYNELNLYTFGHDHGLESPPDLK